MINALWPEMSALLLLESSQAKTPSGSDGTSFLKNSGSCLVASDLASATGSEPSLRRRRPAILSKNAGLRVDWTAS